MESGDTPIPYAPTAGSATPTLPEPAAIRPPASSRRAARPRAPGHPQRRESFFKRRIAPLGAALVALLAKIKAILLLLPKIKLLVTAGTMLVSIVAYTTIWGFWFAVGFVVLLLVHEMGHVIAAAPRGDQGVGARCSSRSWAP